jgi:hypothetical protein
MTLAECSTSLRATLRTRQSRRLPFDHPCTCCARCACVHSAHSSISLVWNTQVWHNYSFDRAMMWRHGINVKGFGGDTIHMYVGAPGV